MIKTIIIIIYFGFLQAFGQNGLSLHIENQSNLTLSDQLENAFSDLNKAKISSGILYNKIIWYTDIDLYDGREHVSPLNDKKWRQLYYQIYNAHISRADMPDLTQLNRQATATIQNNQIPIAILNYHFHRFKEDAFEKGLLKLENNKIIEGTATESPYRKQEVFAASALTGDSWSKTVTFIIDKRFVFSNKQLDKQNFEIDFDDGQGYTPVKSGQAIRVIYATAGEKNIQVREKSAGELLRSQFILTIQDFDESIQPDVWWEDELSAYPYLDEYAAYDAYVFYGQNHTAIEKPIIFAEGFDFDNELGWQELYELLDRENFVSTLREQGYDMIILNWRDPVDYVQRNSLALVTLVEKVLAQKSGNEPVVVGGASMGGLVARYALALMEQQDKNHQCRLFISFDSPQNGANIPLGIQEWVDFFSDYDATADMFLDALNSEAAQQMLIYHHWTILQQNAFRLDLYNDLEGLNFYPSARRLKKVAISNGSGQGLSAPQLGYDEVPMDPGSKILNWKKRSFLVDVDGDVWAVPNLNPQTRIFEGRVDILGPDYDAKQVFISGTQPLDNAPGGWRSTQEQIADVNPRTDILGITVSLGNISTNFPRHAFIPAVSALDLQDDSGEMFDVFADFSADTSLLKHTSFDDVFYAQNTINEEHVDITASNSAFLLKHINFIDSALYLENYYIDHQEPVFKAIDLIQAGGQFVIADSGDVEFKAGNKIVLKAGFQAKRGAHFYAHIADFSTDKSAGISIQVKNENEPAEQLQMKPQQFGLLANYPNPFNPVTIISYQLPQRSKVTLTIYDMLGRQVAVLVDAVREAGNYKIQWHADNVASGIYFYQLQAGDFIDTKKMVLMR